eukprot:3934661-Rhodomonas_salina.1
MICTILICEAAKSGPQYPKYSVAGPNFLGGWDFFRGLAIFSETCEAETRRGSTTRPANTRKCSGTGSKNLGLGIRGIFGDLGGGAAEELDKLLAHARLCRSIA